MSSTPVKKVTYRLVSSTPVKRRRLLKEKKKKFTYRPVSLTPVKVCST